MSVVEHVVDRVLIVRAAELTGYSVKAIRCKIDTGVWVENREWFRAPDGRRLVSLAGYRAWTERGAGK